MKKFNIVEGVTMELSKGKSIEAYNAYLKAEESATEALNCFHQAIEDVYFSDGDGGYDRSDLYDWECESQKRSFEAWEAWEAFCA